jgi:hypothetical protein
MASTFRRRMLVAAIAAGLGASFLAAAASRAAAATNAISLPSLSETATIGTAVSLPVSATDTVVETLSFMVYNLPSGLSYTQTGPDQITISGTPTAAAAGTTTTTITATNPLDTDVAFGYIDWTIHGTITIVPVPDRTSTVGDSVQQVFSATDSVASEGLSYSVSGLPPGITVPTPGVTLYRLMLTTAGTYHPAVTVSDDLGAKATETFTWTVKLASTGWTGEIRLNLGGKCLDGNGTKVQIWSCNSDGNQIWTVAQDWTVRIHGQCLTETGTTNRSRVVLAACNGSKAQQWTLLHNTGYNPGSSAYAYPALINVASGKCLDDTGQSTVNGTAQEVWSCNTGKNQTWTPPAAPIQNMIPGMCLADPANATANGTRVVLWQCNGWKEENWTFEPDGTIRIHGKCLDDAGNSSSNGAAVVLETCNGSMGETWSINPVWPFPNDTTLYNERNPYAIGVNATSAVNGTPVSFIENPTEPGVTWRPL